MASQKYFIEKIRREKFSIGARAQNRLAPELHQAIKQLSVELYQNDIHFIKELIQNAEDNRYEESVSPSLEFMLIKEDVAEVGASATLLVFNNEKGLSIADVEALCSVACSTKTRKRNEGYIGCKGIGFKSVFMVCETPIIISSGYRISFRGEASEEAGVGYIVPEWRDSPTDGAIKAACGRQDLPNTVIILPIRDGKADLVRKQLMEISPEIILFLSRIRELTVIDNTKDALNSGELMKITRSAQISGITSTICKFFKVSLSVIKSGKDSDTHSYIIFRRSFPVTHPVQERQEIQEWAITLAFPLEGRPTSGNVGDVFSFLPTELRTGFPFIVNADFILTSSRETIRFDSAWNVGILDCIPAAFRFTFLIMIRSSSKSLEAIGVSLETSKSLLDGKDAYKYLPCNNIENAYRRSPADADEHEQRQVRQKLHIQPHQAKNLQQLEKVRRDIFQALGNDALVLLSKTIGYDPLPGPPYITNSRYCLQIKSSFLSILESAVQDNHPAPAVVHKLSDGSSSQTGKFKVVDGYVQKNYATALDSLGVRHMSAAEYLYFLTDSQWLLKLPDELYWKVLTIFAFEIKAFNESKIDYSDVKKALRLVKVRGDNGVVELVTLDTLSTGTELFYTSSLEGAEWISKWVKEFNPWHSARVMPIETSQALRNAINSEELRSWLKKHGSLTELSVQSYSLTLIERLMVVTENKSHSTQSILIVQFFYSAVQAKLMLWQETVERLQTLSHISIVVHKSTQIRGASLKVKMDGGVLLPPSVSKWPLLFAINLHRGCGRSTQCLMAMSDLYLDPQSALVKNVVNRTRGPGSMLEFIRESFYAVDTPFIKIPTNEPFPFSHPVSIEKSSLLLEWLKVQLPNRRKAKRDLDNDVLLKSLKTLDWMQTVHHGWQCPTSVSLSASDCSGQLTPRDLPFLDVSAYSGLDLNESDTVFVLEELEVTRDMRKGCTAVAKYFERLPAEQLDQEVVKRFYSFLHECQWRDETQCMKVWIPATRRSKVPYWRSTEDCMIKDEDNVFANSRKLSVLDKLYDASLLPFFSEALSVPEKAPADLYCEIWLKWCKSRNLDKATKDNGNTSETLFIARDKVQSVWRSIFQDWREVDEVVWESFVSSAWVPVAPNSEALITAPISIVPPSQVFIADDLTMPKLFSRIITSGKLNLVWQLPDISRKQLKSLTELYSELGVRKLTEIVKSDISIPPNVWIKEIPRGEGLICEGLLRSILAYLCHSEKKHGLSSLERQKILSGLISVVEMVVSEPFNKAFTLQTDTITSTRCVTNNTLAYYDKVKGKLFYLNREHALLQTEVAKRDFNTQLATTLANGILSSHLELVPRLITLLKLLGHSSFAMDSVEYELQEQNLVIYAEDEKVLMEHIQTRQEIDSAEQEFMMSDLSKSSTGVNAHSSNLRAVVKSESALE